ncbi:MAG: DedA family protein [Candidatus Marinimicrobia bacterium]|nr:DedA family protein [Candidatus Neomarinimicrobiota bacterium]MBT4713324.1 DedA family protein [Candidatus Neomarinimicrobiota bacterium]MBT4945137.1 DedA family protein [Candidatus Neomarinimicrobiota bacterium]MBT5270918.1 DedA family protein [Candidatus Neomarinimicrobiota bacterium]MBT6011479.1 DedA family protein [Candidatus Neomarinimicrobiota bacterium]
MLESLFSFIEQSPAWLVFLTVFLASYLENIFPPVPGDTILIFGAYLVGRGDLSFATAMVTTLLGSVLGFLTLYVAGYKYGRGFIYSKQQTWFSPSSIKRVEVLFEKWGYGVVLINRFLAGLRSVIGLFSGVGKLNIWKVIILATISSLLWNGTLIWLGSTIGENWELIGVYLKRYNTAVTIIILIILSAFLIHRYVIVKENLTEKDS